jgi:hypothetical protein
MGLSWEVYQGLAAVPWNETGFWGLLKQTPAAQQSVNGFFQSGKLFSKFKNPFP